MDLKPILRKITHLVFWVRQFNDKCVKEFATKTHNKDILEIGSGKPVKGKYIYSSKKFFDNSNRFTCSDVTPGYGHKVIDATKMSLKSEFDIVLCLSVLEHVFEFEKVIKNIHNALRPGGTALIVVPGFYPLHDEPNDYWRFTEHSVRKILKDFKKIIIKRMGIRQYPLLYYIEATK